MFYVYCDDDCRHEALTKEEVLAAIQQALEQGYVSDPSSAIFSKIKEINANGTAQLWIGTETQFNAISPKPATSNVVIRLGADGKMYLCNDDSTLAGKADAVHTHEQSDIDGLTSALGSKMPLMTKWYTSGDMDTILDPVVTVETQSVSGMSAIYDMFGTNYVIVVQIFDTNGSNVTAAQARTQICIPNDVSGDIAYRVRLAGASTTFSDWVRVYSGKSIICSDTEPTGRKGMVWLKPIE